MKKILVIEDDIAMREIVVRKLSTNGYEVKQAEDGQKALELFGAEHPDLVLLDLMLPVVDGFHILEAIRHYDDKKIADTPVIVLSNLWSNQDILRAQSLNVQGYMVKAYHTPEEILAKVNEVLGIGK